MSYVLCIMATLSVPNAVLAQSSMAGTTPAKIPATHATQTPPPDEANVLFSRWDTDHNGALSPDEFRIGWHQLQATAELRRLHEQFVAMDTDKNGCLNAAEYAHLTLIQHAGKSAPPMSTFDTEKNHCLDFKEYVNTISYMLKYEHK